MFDRHAQTASQTPGWRLRQLKTSHLPYITNPRELASFLLEMVDDGSKMPLSGDPAER